jgi:hypothetical protein
MNSCYDAHGLVGRTGRVSAEGLEVSWASPGVGVNNLFEDGCVLKFQIWGWGELYVCHSADCCV